MSRTPERLPNKTGETIQGWFYGLGTLSGFISWGLFENNNDGKGMIFGAVCVLLFYIGSKVKTTYNKKGEVGVYK
jgi:hypothetical protein